MWTGVCTSSDSRSLKALIDTPVPTKSALIGQFASAWF